MISKILKFGAEWCGPCKVLHKTLQSVDIPVEEIDVDENEEKAEEFGIRNIPVMVFLDEHNNEVERTVGALNLIAINNIIQKYA